MITINFEHQEIEFNLEKNVFSTTSDNFANYGTIQDAMKFVLSENNFHEVTERNYEFEEYQYVDLDSEIQSNKLLYIFTGEFKNTEEF